MRFVALSLATRLPFLLYGLVNVDEGAHLVGAWTVLHGGGLYTRFADNKPPAIYACYALAQILFGSSLTAVRLFSDAVLVPLTALGIAAFHRYDRAGRAAGAAFIVASACLLAADAHATNCEMVMLPALAWSVATLRDAGHRPTRALASGLLLGVAALGKQPALACLPVLALLDAARVHDGRSGRLGWLRRTAATGMLLLTGTLVPLVGAYVYFLRRGAAGDFVYWTWTYNLLHVRNPMPFGDVVRRFFEMGLLITPAVALLAAPALFGGTTMHSAPMRRFLWALLAATTAPALLGGRFFGHYFLPTLFALALSAAPQLGVWASRPLRRAGRRYVFVAALAFGIFTLVNLVAYLPRTHLADAGDPIYRRVGDALASDGCDPGGAVFVWGYAPSVYYYSGRPPASRFVVPIDTITGYLAGNDAFERGADTSDRINATHWQWLMDDLARSRPVAIVDFCPTGRNHWDRFPLDRFPALRSFVRAGYVRAAPVDGVALYRRKDCPGAS